jgi:hypothetical protein
VSRYKPPLQWPPIRRRSATLRTFDVIRRFSRRWVRPVVIILCLTGVGRFLFLHREEFKATSAVYTPQISEILLPINPLWSRPKFAPNGSEWPKESNYIAGYPRLNVFGEATIVADNSGGKNDLFGKLIDLDQKTVTAVRVFYLKAKSTMELQSIKPGHYDIRYMNLDTGRIRQTNQVEVTLKSTSAGDEYMGWTIGLYEVVYGNNYHRDISEREF